MRTKSFSDSVYAMTSMVPMGRVTTYGAIAKAMGVPGAARAVGQALGANPNPIVVPCHRVVRADGVLGGYSGCLLYTSPSPRDPKTSRMPSSA